MSSSIATCSRCRQLSSSSALRAVQGQLVLSAETKHTRVSEQRMNTEQRILHARQVPSWCPAPSVHTYLSVGTLSSSRTHIVAYAAGGNENSTTRAVSLPSGTLCGSGKPYHAEMQQHMDIIENSKTDKHDPLAHHSVGPCP